MSAIRNHIEGINSTGRLALSIFLTAGFPAIEGFTRLAKSVLDAGADMIELGIPFSDPLADGPVIQHSSMKALANGVNMKNVFLFADEIASYSAKPVILMGYANPLLKYGLKNFYSDCINSGVKGIIIPDIPAEEYDDFFKGKPKGLDAVLLAAPTSGSERIKMIDAKSRGFVYCVSTTGTTGAGSIKKDETIKSISVTRKNVTQNKMMVGFGISTPEDIKTFAPYCDGVIVGSALIKYINNYGPLETPDFIRGLAGAL